MSAEKCACLHPGAWCSANHPDGGYSCTLPLGHQGDHMACGCSMHNLASWPQETGHDALEAFWEEQRMVLTVKQLQSMSVFAKILPAKIKEEITKRGK